MHLHGEDLPNPGNVTSALQPVQAIETPQHGFQLLQNLSVDPITAIGIQQLMVRKDAAVAAENYDEAKQLKSEIEYLKITGGQILELENRCWL